MSECGHECPCGNHDVAQAAPAPVRPVGCYLIMKDGQRVQVDFSATQMKFMRRTRDSLTLEGKEGKVLLDCSLIRKIVPIAA